MNWEWVVLYALVVLGFGSVRRSINNNDNLTLQHISSTLDRISDGLENIAKYYSNEPTENLGFELFLERQKKQLTIYDFAEMLSDIQEELRNR